MKFLILEILSYVFYKNKCYHFLSNLSKGGRIYLKDNYRFINNKLILKYSKTSKISCGDLKNLNYSNF